MSGVTQSTSIVALAKALLKTQGALQPAVKDSTNPFFKSKYADLEAIWNACREALQANGLTVTQFPGYSIGDPPFATLTTVLIHESGEWIAGTAGAPLKQPDAQGVGSALTYLRRYALAAVIGVVTEDDDGNAASRSPKKKAYGIPGGNPEDGVIEERGGTSTASVESKGGAAPASGPAAPTPPKRITEADEFPTRDTLWPYADKLQGKSVRQWALNQLRAAESGEVKIPDEWLAIVKLELKARAAKAAT